MHSSDVVLSFFFCLVASYFRLQLPSTFLFTKLFLSLGYGTWPLPIVAKIASHAIFRYNVLAIDDTHNTWTNICVKMIIIRLIDPRDEKIQNPEEIRSKGLRQR